MWELWVNMLLLLALGILGASSVIVKKKPEAKELIDKLAKISGYLGIVAVLWGVWDLISVIRYIGMLGLGLYGIITWVTLLAVTLTFIGLGIIFGYGLAASYMSEEAKSKSEQLRQKLVGYQIPLGWVAIILAIWLPVYSYIISRLLM